MRYLSLLLLLPVFACANRSSSSDIPRGKVIDTVTCAADATQSYAVYVPAGSGVMPVVYCFDSHGVGAMPVRKYKALADACGFILVGSNNSKNGNDYITGDHIWAALSADTRARLPIDTGRVYACGFSGGAKVASYLAILHPEIKSVILGGAALPDRAQVDNFDFDMTLLTGDGDMNMTDLVGLDRALDVTRTRHRILFFHGVHEWAPDSVMRIAFLGLQRSPTLSSAFRTRVEQDLAGQHFRLAEYDCRAAVSYLGVGWFAEMGAKIAADPAYQAEARHDSLALAREDAAKGVFAERLGNPDKVYWARTIDSLHHAGGAMAQRLTAFLSLEFYMYSTHFLNAGDNDAARYFVDLYTLDDPTNSEGWYLSAVLFKRAGLPDSAAAALKEAQRLGFNDAARVSRDGF
ncbi:MAG TPA: hypothetical protein VL547_02215 [Dinghuibacter sp.]|uniref:hypothetical protein n=1 Tax=Dinghuibacter sp. TaxID=2024697 RepID=UPI002C2C3AE3|nr:hypothetical protein [Dinghuibacter sp.]HTJ10806.1 hypothetical protein [Dinghuibacter sp.]